MAAMVNMNLNNMLNVKDSRWLQLEVCREYQRSKCSRSDTECKFAHPPPSVEVQNGRVVACYDSIKGRCNREKPPCKYFHPPQHLKDQLLINGRNHLALKNALMLQMGMSPGQHILPGQMQTIPTSCASSIGGFAHHHVVPMQAAAPYLAAAGIPQLTAQSAYSPYAASPAMLQVVGPEGVSSMMGYAPAPATKLQRSDRIEVCREFQRGTCRRPESECRYAHPPEGVVIEMQPAGFTASHSTQGLIGMEPGSGPGPGGGTSLVSASISPVAASSSPSLATTTSVATVADVTTTAVAVHLPVVTVCMDAMRGRCSRDPCRYFHPPPHLHAALLQRQQRNSHPNHHHHALPNIPPIASCPPTMATAVTATTSSVLPVEGQNLATRKRTREWDRNQPEEILAYPGMVQGYKRSAGDKSGLPVYQPSAAAAGASAAAAAYHQAQAQAIMQLQQPFVPVSSATSAPWMLGVGAPIPNNAYSVQYTDEHGQLLDTLPVCRDFKYGECKRCACKFVHVLVDYVDMTDLKVTVCRDAVKGQCFRHRCKFYHIPISLPPASLMQQQQYVQRPVHEDKPSVALVTSRTLTA